MSITETRVSGRLVASACPAGTGSPNALPRPPRDLQRTFQLALATVWLLDAVLQLQPFMFTPGSNGFSGMLHGLASGNPSWIAHSIAWNASIVDHHPVSTNAPFALIQFLIGFGIVSTRTLKPALALSIVWSLAVWWFGEGLGRVFSGGATPFGGGPGGCALLRPARHPAVAADGLRPAVRRGSGRRGEGGEDHLGGRVGAVGPAVGRRVRTVAPSAARPGRWNEQCRAGLADPHRCVQRIVLAPSRHERGHRARRHLPHGGRRRLPASALCADHFGSGHCGVCGDLGGRPELRWNSGWWGH
jgi:hypothetical protein